MKDLIDFVRSNLDAAGTNLPEDKIADLSGKLAAEAAAEASQEAAAEATAEMATEVAMAQNIISGRMSPRW